jgi:hypothetical protein
LSGFSAYAISCTTNCPTSVISLLRSAGVIAVSFAPTLPPAFPTPRVGGRHANAGHHCDTDIAAILLDHVPDFGIGWQLCW